MFLICHVTSHNHLFKWTCLNSWGALTLGHQVANFDCFRRCGSVDKTFLICHVISKGHMFKGLCDFMGRSPL